jgi:hypothetical protein
MPLIAGTRLGPYEITSSLGAGGMARSTRHAIHASTARSLSRSCRNTRMAIAVRDGKLTPLVTTPFRKGNPSVSPNGKWLAYTSDESGGTEVYVQPYPALDQRWQVSTSGGDQPVWSRNGRELFFRAGGKMMAVDIEDTSSFVASSPRPVFDDHFDSTQSAGHTCYDVSPDGKTFLMVTRPTTAQGAITHLNVVLNR